MNRLAVAFAVVVAARALAAPPEPALAPDSDQLYAAVCAVASIPAPHGHSGQVELGGLVAGDDRVDFKTKTVFEAPRHGWVMFSTDEATLHVSAEQFIKDLQAALGRRPADLYPAPCVVKGSMQTVVITGLVKTPRGFVGVAAVDNQLKAMSAPEPDEGAARVATMRLAAQLAGTKLTPAWVGNLSGGRGRSGAKSGWAGAADAH
ncbi:MAG: hypothetical protein U0228_04540 [Myxococcaceae bacterium]